MPDSLGKYELKREIGKGATGTVYLAFDTYAQQDVAVKVIDSAIFADPEHGALVRRQFLNEASLVGKLAHPHIVMLLDAVVNDDSSYIAMEYVPGGNLLPFTHAQNLLPPADAIEIGFKCCGALDYASRQGIVHCDIKPANIMVVQGTEIKIADFGAALLLAADNTQIVDIGTPSYMSPEQISGGMTVEKSDMFSLGVVLYELLTGDKPFRGDTPTALLDNILSVVPDPVHALRPALPAALNNVVMRALAKNPEVRYPTWADFALELAEIGRLSVYQQDIPDSGRFSYLRGMHMLKPLSDPEIWELVHASKWRRVPSRSVVIREDEPGASLLFLAAGEVKVTKYGRLLNVLRSGECCGEMGYIKRGDARRQATVEALTEIVVAEVSSDALTRRVSTGCRLKLEHALLNTLVDRLAMADTRIARIIN